MLVLSLPVMIITAIVSLLLTIDFLSFLFTGERWFRGGLADIAEFVVIVLSPLNFLLLTDIGHKNECCGGETAVFSPTHRISIYLLIAFCIGAYYYSKLRKKLSSPLIEVAINSLLFTAIVLNILIAFQMNEAAVWLIGNLPIMILFFYRLVDNQNAYLKSLEEDNGFESHRLSDRIARFILRLDLPLQFPILALVALPLLFVLSAFVMIFSQKPDSLVRSFTDTYKHGFSQLDYQCEGVQCGGHYLCTIAAKGHRKIVKPLRLGMRGSETIICNRQLLISNAFEELIQDRWPFFHRGIRKVYDRIGRSVHKHYWLFNFKIVSDLIYFFMKPLEWFFIFILYFFDKKPENRIARQYLITKK